MKNFLLAVVALSLLAIAATFAYAVFAVGGALAAIGAETGASDGHDPAPLTALVEQLSEAIELSGGVEYLAEPAIDQLVDRLNESGYNHQPIDQEDPLLRARIILICEGMNERVARHVVERLIYLDSANQGVPIDLRIATSGGWTDSAFAIVDTMQAIRSPVNVTALGGCYSAGTVILAAGTGTRTATPNAVMSVHVNDFAKGGDLEFDTRELARFREVYRRHTDVPQKWFDTPGDNQYYLNAQQALEMGLIDEVAKPEIAKPNEETDPEAAPADRPAA